MHVELAQIAQKHSLSAAALADLEAVWSDRARALVKTVDGYRSVDLDPSDAPAPAREARGERDKVTGRYEDLGLLGMGGMGEVRRVRDTVLNRTLAMKTVLPQLVERPAQLARFFEEAQATSQLQHPNILPVHDLGRLPDGRVWFTMQEVRGRTLREAIDEVHAVSVDQWEATGSGGWTLRRLMTAFHAMCNAVAYAHERGVVHRDLKPDNVMVGTRGEVYVVDWGLAKIVGRPDLAAEAGELDVVRTERSESAEHLTRVGQIAGTPAYMPPEQARGEIARIDARSDVYALGAILYEILSGRPPYEGAARAVLQQVLNGPPVAVGRVAPSATFGFTSSIDLHDEGRTGPLPPEELVAACERAMSRDPASRQATATALASEVQSWLDGEQQTERALGVTRRALAGAAEAATLVTQAASLRAESAALLEGVADWEPEERKAPGWAKAALADAAEREAELKELEVDEGLQGALRIAADLPEAHAALAERYRTRHAAAETARRLGELAKAQTLLTVHATALPEAHPTRRAVASYLNGDGALTLVTDPPGAEVLLYRYVEHHRRRVEVFERSLGPTPLRSVSLQMGSYLCVLRHPERAEVRYPVELTRQGHWDGVAPDEREPHAVWLPPTGTFADDEVYVPAGWFRAGGDVSESPAVRLWCDAFVMDRFPVTNARYLTFLDDLVARGREEEALRHAPRERAGTEGALGALSYGRDEAGRFRLVADAEGDVWLPEWPVFNVDWYGARTYLAWQAARTGRPWRLPGEREWEKAARGVDGRFFPWGDALDPSWCCMTESHRGPHRPSVVDSYPVDTSPCGVRGLGGGVQDWCLDLFDRALSPAVGNRVHRPDTEEEEPLRAARVVRGGAYNTDARRARSAGRNRLEPTFRYSHIGFRGLFRPVPENRR